MDFNVMDTSVDNDTINMPTDASNNQSVDTSYTYDSNQYTSVEPEVSVSEPVEVSDAVTNIENISAEKEDDLDKEMAEITSYYDQLKNITIENLKLEKQLKEIEDKIKLNNDTKKEIKEKYADKF